MMKGRQAGCQLLVFLNQSLSVNTISPGKPDQTGECVSSQSQIYEVHLSSIFPIDQSVSLSENYDNFDICKPYTPNEIPTNDSAVDLVSEAVLFARSIIELVIAEVGEVEDFRELVTETELDLGVGEDWDRMEDGLDDVAATELDLRL